MMRVLMVNKFLYPNGGSETYIFKLGDYLVSQGHEVQYFGMEHEGRCVGNAVDAYTSDMDFHNGSKLSKLTYPIKTIYSSEARKKIREVLDNFEPDVVHLNNFNYQLTPSIILEAVKWRKEVRHNCRIVFTAHDYQLLCPNHQLHNPNTHENCEKCLGGHFVNCIKGKCIHGSTAKSVIGTMEAYFWKWTGVYKYIDTIICPSVFMKEKMDTNPLFAEKTVAIHNFIDKAERKDILKKDYVLYFGRFSEEKGIKTLLNVCQELPDIQFVFAGTGPLEESISGVSNIKNVGFQTGEALEKLIREARFSIYPSEWYENCPFSVMESQMYGTPVVGADIGGIPELIKPDQTGKLFKSGNDNELKKIIRTLWEDQECAEDLSEHCLHTQFADVSDYGERIIPIYIGGGITVAIPFKTKYIFYFGRYSREKGIETLCSVSRKLPDISFVFAGRGPLKHLLDNIGNVKDIGFQTQEHIKRWIENARLVVVPSEWYEPFGLSVVESLSLGTPGIGADIAGIREIIGESNAGILFDSGNEEELKEKILLLWNDDFELQRLRENCMRYRLMGIDEYYERLLNGIYAGEYRYEDTDNKNCTGRNPC